MQMHKEFFSNISKSKLSFFLTSNRKLKGFIANYNSVISAVILENSYGASENNKVISTKSCCRYWFDIVMLESN